MNHKEQTRLMVLSQIDRAEITAVQAAVVLRLSLRQVRRILAAYRKEGAAALAHGNRGRTPSNALDPAVVQRVVALAQTTYAGCNHQHYTELLDERERVHLSRSTVRRLLRAAGQPSPRTRRAPKHHARRERMPQEGMLLQLDASPHDWLQGRGPRLTLVGAIDDATGAVPWALFREQEDAHGYFLLLEHIATRQGVPVAVYHDRHSIFQVNKHQPWTLAEELAGRQSPTQFGRLLVELGIHAIAARSPQAKGRVERLWGTVQDRLVTELRLAGASTLPEANCVLWEFLSRFNRRFAVPAAQPGSAYQSLPPEIDPATRFCFKYLRTVGADNVVRFGEHRLQVQPSSVRASYARARVEVHERLNGSLAVYYQGQCLVSQPAPPDAPVLRLRKNRRPTTPDPIVGEPVPTPARSPNGRAKPAADHPWRQSWVTKSLNT